MISGKRKEKGTQKSALVMILIYITCLACLIVILCASVYALSIRNYFKKEIQERSAADLERLSSAYELLLGNITDGALVFIENDAKNVMALYGENEEEYKRQMYRHLSGISRMASFLDSVYFYDTSSEMVYLSSGISYEIQDFYDGSWLSSLKKEGEAWEILSARQIKEASGNVKNVVPVVIRYPFTALETPYLYIIHLRADQMFRYMLSKMYDEENEIFKIADKNQNIFISSDSGGYYRNLGEFSYLEPHLEEIRQKGSGGFRETKEGVPVLVHFFTSEQSGWTYLSEGDYNGITRKVREPLVWICILTPGILLICLIIGVLFSRRLYAPIRSLTDLIVPERKKKNEYEALRSYFYSETLQNSQLQDTVRQNAETLKKHFFYNLLAKNYYTKEEIESQAKINGIETEGAFVVLLFAVDEWKAYLEAFSKEEQALWEYAYENICLEGAGAFGRAWFVGMDANRFALLLLPGKNGETKENRLWEETAALKLAEKLQKILQEFIHFTFSAGIGKACTGLECVNQSYSEAVQALGMLEGSRRQIMCFRDVERLEGKLQYSGEDEARLTELLRLGEKERVMIYLPEMYRHFAENNVRGKAGLTYFSFLVFTAMMKTGNEFGLTGEILFGEREGEKESDVQLLAAAMRSGSEEEIMERLLEAAGRICDMVQFLKENVQNDKVKSIMEYIRKNYQKPITLPDISQAVGLNQSTVSRMMKQHLKMSTVDYVNQVRIEKALEKMKTGGKKVFEIAEETGFGNTHYFIRVFKKLTGKTPGAWMEENE